jgi:hypothetical protein
MPDETKDWFQIHVVESLDEIKKNQKEFADKFDIHIQKDNESFEAIRTDFATTKAAHEATAKAEAKFWSVIGGGVSLAVSSAVHFFTKGH